MPRSVPKVKVCRGPLHPDGKAFPVDVKYWYFRKSGPYAGHPMGPCRDCRDTRNRKIKNEPRGYVPMVKVQPLMRELVQRCDGVFNRASEASGINPRTVVMLYRGDRALVQKKTVRKLVLALARKRQEDRLNGGTSEHLRKVREHQARLEDRAMRMVGE